MLFYLKGSRSITANARPQISTEQPDSHCTATRAIAEADKGLSRTKAGGRFSGWGCSG